MKNSVKCQKCGAEIAITEALKHQIEEEVVRSLESKHKLDLEQAKLKIELEIEKTAKKELLEEQERSKKLGHQIEELLDQMRKLKHRDEEREIEMKRKLFEEEEKIRLETRNRSDEEHKLKELEQQKIINDLKNALISAQRKAQQGSQQTQGESLELEIESKLKAEFPDDKILEVKKGVRGADVIHEVYDKLGRRCGTILWETKNAKWTNGWTAKLKDDLRSARADLAVLISVHLPQGVESFKYQDGVWVTSWKHFVSLAWALRFNLVSLYHERQTSEGKDEKMKVLYEYLTGPEFKHRVEGIVEAFGKLQEELEKEKRWFSVKWARQEKELRKIIDHTHGMYGDFQGVVGKSLQEIDTLKITDGEDM